jgi:hypothetical protein
MPATTPSGADLPRASVKEPTKNPGRKSPGKGGAGQRVVTNGCCNRPDQLQLPFVWEATQASMAPDPKRPLRERSENGEGSLVSTRAVTS